MKGFSIIHYQGIEIVYINYQHLSSTELFQTMEQARSLILKENKIRPVLINLIGVYGTPDFMNKAKELGKETAHLTSKSAVVGLNDLKKILLNAYNRFTSENMKAFDTEELAKEWLIKV